MNILIDTHILLWYLIDSPRLSQAKSGLVEDPKNKKFLSIASLWEIAIKTSIGKLTITQELDKLVPKEIEILPIHLPELKVLQQLPMHHKDPFDRLIIAQASVGDYHILTDDAKFENYAVRLV